MRFLVSAFVFSSWAAVGHIHIYRSESVSSGVEFLPVSFSTAFA